mmetsp:Transcript_89200/g.207569  ORF Transcript_89200/g.207569 Transcript_89200/m.207569 type:complete len:325 (-) Transcript_89200:19-993(-)
MGTDMDSTTMSLASVDASPCELPTGARPSRQEDARLVAMVQRQLEEHQQQQNSVLSELSERWESRITSLEKMLNDGLEMAAVTTTSMNERLAKFMGLAEVLEGSVKRIVHDDHEQHQLSRHVSRLEDSLTCKVAELQGDVQRLDRDLASQGAEALRTEWSGKNAHSGLDGSVNLRLERLEREIGVERAQRLRLALDVQESRCDVGRLHALLDTTNDHLASLAQELTFPLAKETDLQVTAVSARSRGLHDEVVGLKNPRCGPSVHKVPRSGSSRFGGEAIERIEEEDEEHGLPSAIDSDIGLTKIVHELGLLPSQDELPHPSLPP